MHCGAKAPSSLGRFAVTLIIEMLLLVGRKGFRTIEIENIDLASIYGTPKNEFHRPELRARIPLFNTIAIAAPLAPGGLL